MRLPLALLGPLAACALSACGILVDVDDLRAGADGGAFVDAIDDRRPDEAGPDGADGASPPRYAAEVLADTPLAYWRLDEKGGSVANDSSGNGNHAAYVGIVQYAQPGALPGEPSSRAVTLGGGYLSASDKFGFPGAQPFTLEAWIRPDSLDATPRRIFAKARVMGSREGYEIFLQDAGNFSTGFETWVGGQNLEGLYLPPIVKPQQAFVHVVAVRDPGTLRMYVDGTQVGSTANKVMFGPVTEPFTVGASANGAAHFLGSIDEVAVYDRALAEDRIKAHFAAR